jgi:hypothetical protein
VEDEGKGIPAEIQSKISSGGLTGVGLRGMRERVRQFGGHLDVRSNGHGTGVNGYFADPQRAGRRRQKHPATPMTSRNTAERGHQRQRERAGACHDSVHR